MTLTAYSGTVDAGIRVFGVLVAILILEGIAAYLFNFSADEQVLTLTLGALVALIFYIRTRS